MGPARYSSLLVVVFFSVNEGGEVRVVVGSVHVSSAATS